MRKCNHFREARSVAPAGWSEGQIGYFAGALAALHGAYLAALDPRNDEAGIAFLEILLDVAASAPPSLKDHMRPGLQRLAASLGPPPRGYVS